jgi:hypothetical protein
MSEPWTPTPLEMMLATTVVLSDHIPFQCEAVLLHGGLSVQYEPIGNTLTWSVWRQLTNSDVGVAVLNGMTRDECRALHIAYQGYEEWKKDLLDRGVKNESIVLLPPSATTPIESRNFLLMGKQKGWTRLVITTQPHHQLRCFLQIISLMDEVDFHPKVYNAPAPGISWTQRLSKPLLGGGEIEGAFLDHVQNEFKSIAKYAQEPGRTLDGSLEYTRNATIPEMLEYLDQRDRK